MATKSDAVTRGQSLIRSYLPELVLIGASGGFALTLAELLSTDHNEGTQLIAVIAAGIGAALCLIGLLARSRLALRALAAGLLLLAISGPVGVFLHAGGEADAWEAPSAIEDARALEGDEDEDEGEEDEGEDEEDDDVGVPPLAPLGLSGLGLLGAVSLLAKED